MNSPWRPILVAAFWLLVWQVVAWLVANPILVASPAQVVAALGRLIPTSGFWLALGGSGLRILLGLLVGLVLGVGLAALAQVVRPVGYLLTPFIKALQAIPVVSFVILVLIWGSPASLTVSVVMVMVAPVAYLAVQAGLRARDQELTEVAQVFGANRWQRINAVAYPAIVPYFATAVQTAIGLAWKAGVSAEVIGLPRGSIGERLYFARLTLATADLLAWTVVIVGASLVVERFAAYLLAKLRAA